MALASEGLLLMVEDPAVVLDVEDVEEGIESMVKFISEWLHFRR
jgi:hypothetical protein